MQKVLLTGITGFIGNAVLTKLLKNFSSSMEITALVRPGTDTARFDKFVGKVTIVNLDLSDIAGLKSFLSKSDFDLIIHIGALRGGRKFSKAQFYASNVQSTEQFVDYTRLHQARLIFCSSVGVFGAIPDELPANNESPYNGDNYYHYTKIACEKIINRAILGGLDAVIVRPSITYGAGDIGFPLQLVKLVKYRIFPVVKQNLWIHLCNIDTISEAFVKLATDKSKVTGKSFIVADMEPVQLQDLVNFIHREIYNSNYPKWLKVDAEILHLGERISRFLHLELWTSRFELISHSWFYQVQDAYEQLGLPKHYTIPDFSIVIDAYLKRKK
ncbi:MAG TPA: NAD(P)-dependent oxidoreductase [Candidatus Cloacimonadota bacterium]|nr:NAD(P)-dependent oxidoreductase [Candidatus Cloacimonadota bacterium]